jgi:hypothetical protein
MRFFRGLIIIYRTVAEFGQRSYPSQERGLTNIMIGLDALGFQDAEAPSNIDRQRIRAAIRDFDVLRTQQQLNRDGLRDVREALEFNSKMMELLNEKVEKLLKRK